MAPSWSIGLTKVLDYAYNQKMKLSGLVKLVWQRFFKARKKSNLEVWGKEQLKNLARLGQPLVVMSAGR